MSSIKDIVEINLIKGNSLEELKKLPNQYIDCCVTSPPYYGLRKYDIPDVIWDSLDDKCEHEWEELLWDNVKLLRDGNNNFINNRVNTDKVLAGCWCNKCKAWKGQLGLEPTYQLYLKHLSDIFREVYRVLKDTGTCFVNIGDTYWGGGQAQSHTSRTKQFGISYTLGKAYVSNPVARGKGYSNKCLIGIPMRFSLMMIDNIGWILRNSIIWHKPNAIPYPSKDRFNVDFENIFFFVKKSKGYFFETQYEPYTSKNIDLNERLIKYSGKFKDMDETIVNRYSSGSGKKIRNKQGYVRNDYPIPKKGRIKRTVWSINSVPQSSFHYATYPEEIVELCIKAGCPKGGIVLDPFMGTGITGIVSKRLDRSFIGIELGKDYIETFNKNCKYVMSNIF